MKTFTFYLAEKAHDSKRVRRLEFFSCESRTCLTSIIERNKNKNQLV